MVSADRPLETGDESPQEDWIILCCECHKLQHDAASVGPRRNLKPASGQ